MKQTLTVLCLIVICICDAQTTSITLSKKFALKSSDVVNLDPDPIRFGDSWYNLEQGHNAQLAYTATLKNVRLSIAINKYDGDMQLVKSTPFQGKGKEFGPFNPQLIGYRDQLLLFFYKVIEDKSIQLSMSVIDPATLEEKETTELYNIVEKNGWLFKAEDAILNNRLIVSKSPDGARLMVGQSGNTDELFSCEIGADLKPVDKRTTSLRDKGKDFDIQIWEIGNDGNRYFSYGFKDAKIKQKGILLLDNTSKASFLTFRQDAAVTYDLGPVRICFTKDSVRLFSEYGLPDNDQSGFMATTLDPQRAVIAKPQFYPLPPDIVGKLEKRDFAGRRHRSLFRDHFYYHAVGLENGTLVLYGCPIKAVEETYTESSRDLAPLFATQLYAGPVINAFIHNGQCKFGVLYRNQVKNWTSSIIVVPYQDKIVCLYTDGKKNLGSKPEDDLEKPVDTDDLILAEAVVDSDGRVLSRKVLGDKVGNLGYFLSGMQKLADNKYVFPLGRNRFNMTRYYTEFEQWVTAEVQ